MSHYHRILGVSASATKEQIKKAYRRKALRLHPDRNPDPKAHEEFIRITEAYDVLVEGKVPKRQKVAAPDNEPVKSRRYGKTMSKEEYEEKMRWAKEYARERAKDHREAVERDYEYTVNTFVYKISHYVAVICLITLTLVTIDSTLPRVVEQGVVTSGIATDSRTLTGVYFENSICPLAPPNVELSSEVAMQQEGDVVYVRRTRLFGHPQAIFYPMINNPTAYKETEVTNIYMMGIFLYFLLFMPAMNYMINMRSSPYYFVLHVSTILSPIMVVITFSWLY